MVRFVVRRILSQARQPTRLVLRACAVLAVAALTVVLPPVAAQAAPVKGEIELSNPGGFARLVIKLDEDIESEARIAGSILIVQFKSPVEIDVDRLGAVMPDYIGAARRDPNGGAIRFALTQKVMVNSMVAGERLFIDLLPESWQGPPPGLPSEVVRELAERARAAERELKRAKRAAQTAPKREIPMLRVRASIQPTFVRYVFDVPDNVTVTPVSGEGRLSLSFDKPVTFDLAEAKAAAAHVVASIEQKKDDESASVEFALVGKLEVRPFRDEKTYVVDVGFEGGKAAATTDPEFLKLFAEANKAVAEESADSEKSDPKAAPAKAEADKKAEPAKKPQAANASPPKIAAPPTMPARDPSEDVVKPTSADIMRQAAATPPAPAQPKEIKAATPAPVTSPPVQPVDPAPAVPKPAPQPAATAARATEVLAKRSLGVVELTLPFTSRTDAAMFSRADSFWIVVDNAMPLDLQPALREGAPLVREATSLPLAGGQAIRLRLGRPMFAAVDKDGEKWVVRLRETGEAPPQGLTAIRNIAQSGRASISIPFASPGKMFRLDDPDAGDSLTVVTASLPARGFVKPLRFIDFALPATVHGVVVQPNSDDVSVRIVAENLLIDRPDGLMVSPAKATPGKVAAANRLTFDVKTWQHDLKTGFNQRRSVLLTAAAMAGEDERIAAHLELARFYIAHKFYPEAVGVMNALIAETKPAASDPAVLMMRAIANILRDRPEEGLRDLADPAISVNFDSQLWTAMGYAAQGKWAAAREKFKGAESAISALPVELQQIVVADALQAALEVRDYVGVSNRFNELDIVGIAPELKGRLAVLRGRASEALGLEKDALAEFKRAAQSTDLMAAAEGRQRDVELRIRKGEISPEDALAELETLGAIWRGDAIELKTLQLLTRAYSEQGRYRESLQAARLATTLQPNAEISRQMQDDASLLFSQVFLGEKGESLPSVEALAMFYEFRALTPIGRRGDEMIRKLADRLVAVDLLDQAAELLKYQVEQRLDGASRAQVASRLAMIYLMNRKPDRALATLHTTRQNDLAGELRQQRLLLEARAQSDVGRHDLALDLLVNLSGREAVRLRSDIYWASRRWRESSEQLELMYGERWRDFQPLSAFEKSDLLRMAIGYSLAEDSVGLARLREKYAPKMAEGEDREAFDAATQLSSASGGDLTRIARMAAAVDTLDGFMRDMKARFPDVLTQHGGSKQAMKADPMPTASLPAIRGTRAAR